ncbi:hypothetical protein IAQ61_008321 [Plenodomus lingam]|uniref:Similar to twin-arginine translocation pathway signal sequence domain protein n=1 Tax=Leptosphaeria maculans (strain JN3 / isolate v23.1.3 / race Av1-4-5-6-7-8) TaxID=985895 RepID=E4ZQC7_LEPMJ|nr:similar to twin-arginine translocation pathway signal sequence domain protein [Plenodomus lingam JN3]KAH9867726.1 hypothetical protein IAQ61_008321 [Plenodomus lingam]CBX93602.1 similar to twin-arginine translocation pathway signal sequence domain protein [Plenodomus lingam JN3]
MSTSNNPLDSTIAFPLWDNEPIDGAFTLTTPNGLDTAVVSSVSRPWLFGYEPTLPSAHRRAILITGGGGYVELMVGREGIKVAKWLTSLGFYAFVLVHRFPHAQTGAQAPVDDARRALQILRERGFAEQGVALCGLSSGGHLAASLLAGYPASWTPPRTVSTAADSTVMVHIPFAIIGYAPISTNAVGRQIIPNKPPLPPAEKQALYDAVQPDVQLLVPAPPTFIVYAGNDPVVPVVNAYRLAEGVGKAGGLVELHVFGDAPHGFGVDTVGQPVERWTDLAEAWMRQGGFLG